MSLQNEFDLRLKKIRSEMDRKQIGVALVYQTENTHVCGNIYYLSNYTFVGHDALVVLPREGEPSLLVSSELDLDLANEVSWIRDIRLSNNFTKEIGEILRNLDLQRSKVGVVETKGDYSYYTLLTTGVGLKKEIPEAKLVLTPTLFVVPAMVKTEMELRRTRKAGKIADVGFATALEKMRVGMTEYELMAEIDYAMRREGMNDHGPFLLCSGKHCYGMHLALERKIEKGDYVDFEISPMYQGYGIQLTRTVVMGEIPSEMRKAFSLIIKAQEESERIIKIGVPISEIARVQNEIIGSVIGMEYVCPPFMRIRGHMFGYGDSYMDSETGIDPQNNLKLQKGMVFTAHPNQYHPDVGYLAQGCGIEVTEDGIEHLTKEEHKLFNIKC